MEYYWATNKNELLIYATKKIKFENIVFSKKLFIKTPHIT
jgi:hypothetical protein